MKRVLTLSISVYPVAIALALAIVVGGSSGCKQSEGDVCQINSDCKDGLECNQSKMLCQKPGAGNAAPDAAVVVVPDAAPAPDADTTDADTTPDADTTDADTTPDAT